MTQDCMLYILLDVKLSIKIRTYSELFANINTFNTKFLSIILSFVIPRQSQTMCKTC